MRVTKKADLIDKFKREEVERRARRDAAERLANDTPQAIAVDCFNALKLLSRVCLANVPFDAAIHVDVYDQLEILRVRLANQGAEVEWREILPDYLKGEYGAIEQEGERCLTISFTNSITNATRCQPK